MSRNIIIIIVLFIGYIFFKYGNLKNASKLEKLILLLVALELIVDQAIYVKTPIIFGLLLFYIFYRRYRNIKYTVDAYNDINYLNRNVDTTYNPSIIGYLINMNIHSSDLIADIMNLYAKKIIDIKKVNKDGKDRYSLSIGENFNEDQIISESDKYIIETLIVDKGKLFNKFEFEKWHEKVIYNYRSTDLMKENALAFLSVGVLIAIIALAIAGFIIGCIISGFFMGLVVATLVIFAFILFRPVIATFLQTVSDSLLSKHGKEVFKKWMKFKKFMQEYTLIKEKNIEDIPIYEHYIPYSVALRIVDNYEDTMYKIFRDFEIENILEYTELNSEE